MFTNILMPPPKKACIILLFSQNPSLEQEQPLPLYYIWFLYALAFWLVYLDYHTLTTHVEGQLNVIPKYLNKHIVDRKKSNNFVQNNDCPTRGNFSVFSPFEHLHLFIMHLLNIFESHPVSHSRFFWDLVSAACVQCRRSCYPVLHLYYSSWGINLTSLQITGWKSRISSKRWLHSAQCSQYQ